MKNTNMNKNMITESGWKTSTVITASLLHTTYILRQSEDLPLVVEIVDSEENIQRFLPHLHQMKRRAAASSR